MTIRIITVGSKPSSALSELIAPYITRMQSQVSIDWIYIKNANSDRAKSIEQESELILSKLLKNSKVILLDELGRQMDSPTLSKELFSNEYRDLTFIIGGAHGVNKKVKDRSDIIMSLSKLVFPHQIVRLILIEQIYRSYTISIGHPYHHT